MVHVVNRLRGLGKDQSLAVLREYTKGEYAGIEDYLQVQLLCRLLFVNPKGWDRLYPGIFGSGFDHKALESFPLFPIALSDRVPFLLVSGYRVAGAMLPPTECLKSCESLSLVPEDYPLVGYEQAARDLTQAESFRRLYKEACLPGNVEMVLQQAND
jgi:hypothetical protein